MYPDKWAGRADTNAMGSVKRVLSQSKNPRKHTFLQTQHKMTCRGNKSKNN